MGGGGGCKRLAARIRAAQMSDRKDHIAKVHPGGAAAQSPLSQSVVYAANGAPSPYRQSDDSFDWIGDDVLLKEEGDEDNIDSIDDRIEACAAEAGGGDDDDDDDDVFGPPIIGRTAMAAIVNVALLAVFAMAAFAILGLCVASYELPPIGAFSTSYWIILAAIALFLPIWTSVGIDLVARHLRSMPAFYASDFPTTLASIRTSLAIAIDGALLYAIWEAYFFHPGLCETITPGITGELLCIYDIFPRTFTFMLIAGALFTGKVYLLQSLRSSFRARTFRDKLLENRFKTFVVSFLLRTAAAATGRGLAALPAGCENFLLSLEASGGSGAAGEDAFATIKIGLFMMHLPFLVITAAISLLKALRARTLSSAATYAALPTAIIAGRSGGGGGGQETAEAAARPMGTFTEYRRRMLRTLNSSIYDTEAMVTHATDLEAKMMARVIFAFLCTNKETKELYIDDFKPYMPNTRVRRDAFNVFDLDREGQITRSEMQCSTVQLFRERQNLARSIGHSGDALTVLDWMGSWLVHAALLLTAMALIGFNVTSLLAVGFSVAFGLNFVVFEGANKTFQAIVFLFIVHPYDIGDKVVIGKTDLGHADEDVLTVTSVHIQKTVFKRWNGLLVSMPNHVIALATLTNISRSREQWERIEFTMAAPDGTVRTVEDETERLSTIRDAVHAFVRRHECDYYVAFDLRAIVAADSGRADTNLDTITFVLRIRCRESTSTHKRWIRHARILAFVKQALKPSVVRVTTT